MRLAIVLAIVALATPAAAQTTRPLSGGWTQHERIGISGIQDIGCGRDVAYARDWTGQVARWDGSGWSTLPRRTESMYGRTLGVTPEGSLFLESRGGVAQWTGSSWIDHRLDAWEGELDSGFAPISSSEVYYAGRGRIARFDGRVFTTYGASTWRQLTAIALAGDDLLVGGQGGTILRFHDGRFTREDTGIDSTILDLVVLAPDDVWARAEGATYRESIVLHWDGHAWSRRDTPGPIDAIGGAAGAVYASSDRGLERWSGTGWTLEIPHADLGAGYHSLAEICATDHQILVADAGGHALVRAR